MNTQKWKEYFIFSKKERIAVTILLVIIFVLVILPFFIIKKPEPVKIDPKLQQQLALLNNDSAGNQNGNDDYNNDRQTYSEQDAQQLSQQVPRELFKFDPNTATENDFKRLGLRDRTIKTLSNYRNKGGHFYKPEDLHKIYGLREDEANALIPYVQIASNSSSQQHYTQEKINDESGSKQPEKTFATKKQYAAIDINTATAEEWKSLPGIGDVLSNRIVKFRNKLGGFTSIEQVKQTYGLSDSTFQIIKPLLKFSEPK